MLNAWGAMVRAEEMAISVVTVIAHGYTCKIAVVIGAFTWQSMTEDMSKGIALKCRKLFLSAVDGPGTELQPHAVMEQHVGSQQDRHLLRSRFTWITKSFR